MTGETALVGVLRAYPQCHGGESVSPSRLRLAYDQMQITGQLAAVGDWDRAASAVLHATQAVVTAPAADQSSIGAALDQALANEGLTAPNGWRPAAVALLGQLASVEHGPYGRGYELREVAANEVWVRALSQ
jgi:uncharacterized protein YpuA (DUF1002 family)